MSNAEEIQTVIHNLDQQVAKASSLFDEWMMGGAIVVN
jgi:hypothetical protein